MELEELKSTWKSVEHKIANASPTEKASRKLKKRDDAITALKKRFLLDIVAFAVGTVLTATSNYWAVAKMPGWWLVLVCLFMGVTGIGLMVLYSKVRTIDFTTSTHAEIISTVVFVKKFYNWIEMISCSAIAFLIILMAFIPPFKGYYVSIAMIYIVAAGMFILEYLWYKRNIKRIRDVESWIDK